LLQALAASGKSLSSGVDKFGGLFKENPSQRLGEWSTNADEKAGWLRSMVSGRSNITPDSNYYGTQDPSQIAMMQQFGYAQEPYTN
jgi:hypothetical protein